MGWIQSHDSIWEHRKLVRFCALTGVCKAQAVGHLHGLWHFVLRNAWKDANLEPWGDAEIERAMFWEGEKGRGVECLRKAGFLDGFIVHDWLEIASGLVSERLYNEHRRKDAVKTPLKRRKNPAKSRVEKSRTDSNTASGFLEFWEAYPRKQEKISAQHNWNTINPTPELRATIMASLQDWKSSDQWKDTQYIKQPNRWLKSRSWEEKPITGEKRNDNSDILV